MRLRGVLAWAVVVSGAALLPAAAMAEPAVDLGFTYMADLAVTASCGSDRKLRYLDGTDLTLDLDLAVIGGWDDARAHIDVLGNFGSYANASAGTLQGVDNIEVGSHAVRLYEAWVEKGFASGSLRAGLYDINREFYINAAALMLISPPFGIGSEFSATGPNGPSTYPSTALAMRLDLKTGSDGGYVRAAVANARASTVGDDEGIDFSFRDGLLLTAEGGVEQAGYKLGAGAWAYTEKREDILHVDAAGERRRQHAWGAYGIGQVRVARRGEEGGVDLFARAGWSNGHTTPFRLGGQAGLYVTPAIASRPDSAFSAGAHFATTTSAWKDSLRQAGERAGWGEYGVEVTFSDKVAPWLTLQPDLQLIGNPGGRAGVDPALVGILRLSFELP